MYRYLFIITIAILIGGAAAESKVPPTESSPVLMLEPLAGICVTPEAAERLEKSLEFQRETHSSQVLAEAFARERCLPMFEYERIALPRQVHLSTGEYICYVLWDITLPMPRTRKNEFCSYAPRITTLESVLKSRSGDYEMVEQLTGAYAAATCLEGGRVSVVIDATGATRWTILNISANHTGSKRFDLTVPLETVIRRGCAGEDYPLSQSAQ